MSFSYIEAVEKSGGVIGPYGERFGRLVVLHLDRIEHKANGESIYYDICQCDCGTITTVKRKCYFCGYTKSCGCYQKEKLKKLRKVDIPRESYSLYATYNSIIGKCYRKSHRDYYSFGGKGITVCDRWLHSLQDFVADVESTIGPRTSSQKFLVRINDNGNFEPGNICWISGKILTERLRERQQERRMEIKQAIADEYKDIHLAKAENPKYPKGPYGKRFGRLFVLFFDRAKIYNNRPSVVYYDMCQCECGAIKSINRQGYMGGRIKSCGCLSREWIRILHKKNKLNRQ